MTAQPEITGSLCKFETCPDWVPAMDSCQQFAWITLKTMPAHGFDHCSVWAAKVRNVSRLGSQTPSKRKFKAGWLTSAPVVRSCLPCALSTRKHATSE